MNRQNDQPEIIKNQIDCQNFSWWLKDHPEVAGIQGYRNEKGTLTTNDTRLSDVSGMWQERRVLNDWIRTYRNQH